MNLIIRKANLSDIDAIVLLNTQLADYHRKIDDYYKTGEQTGEIFKQYLFAIIENKNFLILVAEMNNKPVGYFIGTIVSAKPFLTPLKTGRISDAFIREEYRNLEIGKKMFDKLTEWFKQQKIEDLELSVDARNNTGIKAWKKYGFQAFMIKMKMKL